MGSQDPKDPGDSLVFSCFPGLEPAWKFDAGGGRIVVCAPGNQVPRERMEVFSSDVLVVGGGGAGLRAAGAVAVRPCGGMNAQRTCCAADKNGYHMLHTLFQTTLKYGVRQRYDECFVT